MRLFEINDIQKFVASVLGTSVQVSRGELGVTGTTLYLPSEPERLELFPIAEERMLLIIGTGRVLESVMVHPGEGGGPIYRDRSTYVRRCYVMTIGRNGPFVSELPAGSFEAYVEGKLFEHLLPAWIDHGLSSHDTVRRHGLEFFFPANEFFKGGGAPNGWSFLRESSGWWLQAPQDRWPLERLDNVWVGWITSEDIGWNGDPFRIAFRVGQVPLYRGGSINLDQVHISVEACELPK